MQSFCQSQPQKGMKEQFSNGGSKLNQRTHTKVFASLKEIVFGGYFMFIFYLQKSKSKYFLSKKYYFSSWKQ